VTTLLVGGAGEPSAWERSGFGPRMLRAENLASSAAATEPAKSSSRTPARGPIRVIAATHGCRNSRRSAAEDGGVVGQQATPAAD